MAVLAWPGLCEVFPVMFLTTQHLSPLLVLAFTVERYVAVCHPFYGERISSTRRAVCTTLVLASLALLVNVVQAYFWTYNSDTGDCQLRSQAMHTPHIIPISIPFIRSGYFFIVKHLARLTSRRLAVIYDSWSFDHTRYFRLFIGGLV